MNYESSKNQISETQLNTFIKSQQHKYQLTNKNSVLRLQLEINYLSNQMEKSSPSDLKSNYERCNPNFLNSIGMEFDLTNIIECILNGDHTSPFISVGFNSLNSMNEFFHFIDSRKINGFNIFNLAAESIISGLSLSDAKYFLLEINKNLSRNSQKILLILIFISEYEQFINNSIKNQNLLDPDRLKSFIYLNSALNH